MTSNPRVARMATLLLVLLVRTAGAQQMGGAEAAPKDWNGKVAWVLQKGAYLVDIHPDPVFEQARRDVRENGTITLPILEMHLGTAPDARYAGFVVGTIGGLQLPDNEQRVRILQKVLRGEYGVSDPEGDVREWAIMNADYWGRPEDVKWILASVNDPAEGVRREAVRAITSIGDRSSADLLLRALQKRQERLSAEERADDDLLEYGQQQVAEMLKRLEAAEARPPDEAGSGVGKPGEVGRPPSAQDTPKSSATPTSVETADEDDRSNAAIWWLAGGLAALGTVGWLFVRFRR